MDCEICLQKLELLETVYRMQLEPAINNGQRTSVCSKCLDAFIRSWKLPGFLRDAFRSGEPCEVCGRPVYNLKGVTGKAGRLFDRMQRTGKTTLDFG